MIFKMFQQVILTRNIPEHELCVGDVGTIVEEHHVVDKETGYSVEFFDMTGHTVAVITLPESSFRKPTSADRPSTRAYPILGVKSSVPDTED